MTLISICVLVGIALGLVRSIVVSHSEQPSDQAGVLPPWHSDYKQLRIEYHQSVDKSLSPPK
jgi:hypothetical protein